MLLHIKWRIDIRRYEKRGHLINLRHEILKKETDLNRVFVYTVLLMKAPNGRAFNLFTAGILTKGRANNDFVIVFN